MKHVGDAYPIKHDERRYADEGHRFDEKLRTSESRFAAAVAAVGVLWTNDASGQMSGDQPGWASLTGQSHFEEDFEANEIALATATDDPLAGFETRMRYKDGSAHWVN
ncbi:hypothetical protein [Sphingomonas sp.]|uniref:hypothetical protein n=1 Tax=Sphingomonas sp. TaxID=28214 RepID=UPI0025F086C7|nr:hypothetical protein [Sphingomonas sp.]